jgi:hypothetical protein
VADWRLNVEWPVFPGGYQWTHAKAIPAKPAADLSIPAAGPDRAADAGNVMERSAVEHPRSAQLALIPVPSNYRPLPKELASSLFRIFADVQPDEVGILAFANQYGNLLEVELVPTDQAPGTQREGVRGSLLTDWQRQIPDMLRLVNLWDRLQHEDLDYLLRHIKWIKHDTEGVSVYYSDDAFHGQPSWSIPGPKDTFIASSKMQPELLARLEAEAYLLPGWVFLKEELNRHLRDLAKEISVEMVWDKETNRPGQSANPLTLRSALWLQLADAVTNNRIFNRCRECRTWFEVAPDVARSHRRFCSNGCRSKAYRERQDRARQLYVAKKNFEEIASELDSDVATVKRWITGSKE